MTGRTQYWLYRANSLYADATKAKRERIADLRSKGTTADKIAEILDMDTRNVFRHLAAMRRAGDQRVMRRA
ncbi:MAG: hypothetical protein ACRC6I_18165 [Paracoccaceae bacterium]